MKLIYSPEQYSLDTNIVLQCALLHNLQHCCTMQEECLNALLLLFFHKDNYISRLMQLLTSTPR